MDTYDEAGRQEARQIIRSSLLSGESDNGQFLPTDVDLTLDDVVHLPVEPECGNALAGVSMPMKCLLSLASLVALLNLSLSFLWGHVVGFAISCIVLSHSALVLIFEVGLLSTVYHKISWAFVVGYILSLVSIHTGNMAYAPSPSMFPERCFSYGCSRVTVENPHEKAGLLPIAAFVPLPAIEEQYKRFCASESQTYVTFDGNVPPPHNDTMFLKRLFHCRALSTVFGFADDLYIQTTCDVRTGNLLIEAQSSQRIGDYDFGVNESRMIRLWGFIHNQAISKIVPDHCSSALNI